MRDGHTRWLHCGATLVLIATLVYITHAAIAVKICTQSNIKDEFHSYYGHYNFIATAGHL